MDQMPSPFQSPTSGIRSRSDLPHPREISARSLVPNALRRKYVDVPVSNTTIFAWLGGLYDAALERFSVDLEEAMKDNPTPALNVRNKKMPRNVFSDKLL